MAKIFIYIADLILINLLKFYYKYISSKIEQLKTKLITDSIEHKGKSCQLKWNTKIYDRQHLKLGDYVHIGENSHLFCKGGIEIGSNTILSRNVVIYSANHNINGTHIPYDNTYIEKKVFIGNSVWIGINVLITPGVTIGDGAVIGMGTVISKNVPAGAIVVGNNQRIIRYRDLEDFNHKHNKSLFFGKIKHD